MARKDNKKDEYLLVKEDLSSFDYEVPEDILLRIQKKLQLEKDTEQLTMGTLTKELLAVAPEKKGKLLLSVILAMIGEVFSFASYFFGAYVAVWIYQYYQMGAGDVSKLVQYGLLAFGAILIHLVLTGISTNLSHQTAFEILSKLRIKLFEKLGKVPLGYMIENPVGKIKVTILEKVQELEDWVAHVLPELTSKGLHPIFAIIILFVIDWRIGLSLLAPAPIMILGLAMMMNKSKARGLVWACGYENVADRGAEYVKGIPVIKAFSQEESSYKHFSNAVNFYFESTMDWWRVNWLSSAVIYAAAASPLLATLPVSFKLYSSGEISISSLILTLVIALEILPQLIALMNSMEVFMTAANSWLIISDLLNEKEQERPESSSRVDMDESKGISFEHVRFSYASGVEVLKDVSFNIGKNEVTAFVGSSGSGKSTIAKLISSYWDVDSGTISIGGVNIKDISFQQLMEEISYVSQDNYLFDTSVKDNIRLGKPDATEEEIIHSAKMANCHEFIMNLPNGYETTVGDAGGQLSGGERQRITIARAMIKPANIIVLDEATAYTDPENEALIQEAIGKLIKGKSLIVVAHRLHTIRDAHKIIVVEDGKVIGEGRHDELLNTCETYARLNRQYEEEV